MSGSLYRKYRSSNFSEVIGQEHITKTLQNSIDSNTFSHAYLLTGLRGVGKTSVARIFAYLVNNINPKPGENYPDIIEIDAASNRKIDEIRDLRDKVIIAPTSLKYKVYIIDEVHMLTKESFNALLKTLEEPPEHCIFILATTDYHKLPETIVSRCIRFAFKSIPPDLIARHLENIAKKEKINISTEALIEIAENSSNSMRDAISILDQARNLANDIKPEQIELLLGIANKSNIKKLYSHLNNNNIDEIRELLSKIYEKGASPEKVVLQFMEYLRNNLYENKQSNNTATFKLIEELMMISNYRDQKLAFEICLMKYALAGDEPIAMPEDKDQDKPFEEFSDDRPVETERGSNKTKPLTIEPEIAITTEINSEKTENDIWQLVLGELKKTNSTLYGIARMAEARYEDKHIELTFKFNFHKKQVDLKKNQEIIKKIIEKHNPKLTNIITILIQDSDQSSKITDKNLKNLSTVSNIFGSAEMLES